MHVQLHILIEWQYVPTLYTHLLILILTKIIKWKIRKQKQF